MARGLVVIGCSTGGLAALEQLLPQLPATFPAAVVVVMHTASTGGDLLVGVLAARCALPVREAAEKRPVEAGVVHIAPPGYHLLIEDDHTFALSIDERVQFARPSIDVLFEAAAHAFRGRLVGVILSGANGDGSAGLRAVAQRGGLCLVQDPAEAPARAMPEAALAACPGARVLSLAALAPALIESVS